MKRGHFLVVVLATVFSFGNGQTITFRSLVETSSASLASNDSFVLDGTNSDIAQQLFLRHRAGATGDGVLLNSVPTAVTDRLKPLGITFDELPGLVQRAVLWDSGFAVSPDNDAVQIWTMKNYTMANIAVPQESITEVNCTMLECDQPNDVPAYSIQYCSGTQVLNVSRCVADTFVDSGATDFLGVMWSTGGDSARTPHVRLRDHTWTEPTTGVSYSVYAVHTSSSAEDPIWDQCPTNDGYSSLIVPCHRRDEFTDEEMQSMTTPTGSEWVTTWLKDEFAAEGSGFNNLWLIPIIVGSIVVVAAVSFGWLYWKRRLVTKEERASSCDFDEVVTHYVGDNARDVGNRPTLVTTQPLSHTPSFSDYESAGSNQTFKILLHSQHLQGNRIPYDCLTFHTEISRGGSGEVWICAYGGGQVAVKKLLHTKNQKAEDVQAFAEEIELTASLVHPNIVRFIGVAWNSLNNLVMVLQYVPMGNLKNYLHKNARYLSWARDKIHMATGIAEALEYLHTRTPAIIHRDLKSTNILLSKNLEPKLIDFGLSRGVIDLTMTAGVGTPYWAAPEILEGNCYTEKADIYSFGIMLLELDTGKIPYNDAVSEDGAKMKPFQILNEVMSGTLRPRFSDECPERIRRIGDLCLSLDPADRPSTQELVDELGGRESLSSSIDIESTRAFAPTHYKIFLKMLRSLASDEAISFQSLSNESSGMNSSFILDDSNSDLAKVLYDRYKANDSSAQVHLKTVPTSVINRLQPLHVNFTTLPGLVQRAVLWDTGFAIAPGNVPVQIYPLKGYSMATIALPKANVSFVDCTYLNCSQPNGVLAHYTQYCTGWQMLNASRCVADEFKDPGADGYLGTMWSTGGKADLVPEILLREHKWKQWINEFNANISFSVYSVHTVPNEVEPAWNRCLATTDYASLTVPCIPGRTDMKEFIKANTTTPTGSEWVTTWLKEEFADDSHHEDGSSGGSLVVPILLAVVVVLGTLAWVYWRLRTKLQGKRSSSTSTNVSGSRLDTRSALTPIDINSSRAIHGLSISSPDYESAGSNKTLQILLESEHLRGKRIPYDQLVFVNAISKGASGEVWICAYNGTQVAAKRLLSSKKEKAETVYSFAEEIELSATLIHPNIIEFVGVAWNSLDNLVMVLEYLPMGNLQNYLDKNAGQLSWARDKIHIAIGIAQALTYLHSCTPPLIHRDVKSSNILLTETLEPKIIDFGVSRGRVEQTMTGGVGTPYWTAPEILEGNHYTEQADIYSFGVVLSELDTGKIPYHDAESEDGTKMKPFRILNEVMSGNMRPSFTDECPARIQRISAKCLALDVSSRPTAQELVDELEGKNQEEEEE